MGSDLPVEGRALTVKERAAEQPDRTLEDFMAEAKQTYRADAVDAVWRSIRSFSSLNHGWEDAAKHALVMSILGGLTLAGCPLSSDDSEVRRGEG